MDSCESDGAKLIIINSTDTFLHIISILPEMDWTWIGLQGKSNGYGTEFYWWNGQVASNILWFPGFPKIGYDSVVHLYGGKYANKPIPTMASSFICQKFI
ncbi:hypothetical protein CHS0354_003253 [Potamilus streckersoni]|uniref:C-type lectin domain-containing protein n=1 Tax=Potamilus streckersoni TaxID=2493646 RepID=A0AAE0W259_9BIVA|nr:hypothetical protein CHS0354_003253 [Potamilus streckersoni]